MFIQYAISELCGFGRSAKMKRRVLGVGAILVRAGLLIRRPALSLLYNSFDFILWPRNFLYFSRNSVVV